MTQWRKSSHSDPSGPECVELAELGDHIGVRDSKSPEVGHLRVSRAELASLLRRAAKS